MDKPSDELSVALLRRLAEALAAISQIDRAIKGAEAADPWHALKRVALGLCG